MQRISLHLLVCVGLASLIGVAAAAQTEQSMPTAAHGDAYDLPPIPAAATEPSRVPPNTVVEIAFDFKPGTDLVALLSQAGVNDLDATRAATLIRSAGPITKPTRVTVYLGDRATGGKRSLKQISLRPAFETFLTISRRETGNLAIQVKRLAVDATPLRIRGRVGTNLYWSLRSAGAPADAAAEFLAAISSRSINAEDLGSNDRFDLIVEHRRAQNGETEPRELLFAGLDRSIGADLRLLRWHQAGRSHWVDPTAQPVSPRRAALPVSGPITSNFGTRAHPILGFRRFHRGVDIGAARGTPIHASADGWVAHAGWNGGYGIQVRLAHGGGRATSYSHMSRAVASPGRSVRRGDVIGYVGSSGFSTGAHLHFEMLVDGQAVNPLVRAVARTPIDPADRAVLAVRLRQLLAVPTA